MDRQFLAEIVAATYRLLMAVDLEQAIRLASVALDEE
jgi:hypothetical protein